MDRQEQGHVLHRFRHVSPQTGHLLCELNVFLVDVRLPVCLVWAR